MTISISESQFETACADCANAIDTDDSATARRKYAVAEAINAGLLQRITVGSVDKTRRDRLEGLRVAIDFAFGAIDARSDNRRFGIRTKMSF